MTDPALDRGIAPDPYADHLPRLPELALATTSFTAGGPMPAAQAYTGGNTSPQLSWSGAPAGTASYLLSCFDPDAPTPSGFWHWCVVGIPATVTSLSAGAGGTPTAGSSSALPQGALTLRNDYGTHDFGGAYPPAGDRPHRYIFAVTALDTPLDATDLARVGIDADTPIAKAHFLTLGNAMARGCVIGTYQIP